MWCGCRVGRRDAGLKLLCLPFSALACLAQNQGSLVHRDLLPGGGWGR